MGEGMGGVRDRHWGPRFVPRAKKLQCLCRSMSIASDLTPISIVGKAVC